MNSIRRPRKRPRKNSVNFDALWWVLVREAALRVLRPNVSGSTLDRLFRSELCSVPTDALRVRVRQRLNFNPDRRVVR
jgi:hypothetical protein